MRIALLGDIHGNLQALEAVLQDMAAHAPDVVVVAGDMVNRFVQPRETLELLATVPHIALHGNADLLTVRVDTPLWRPSNWPPHEVIARWHKAQIGPDWADYLEALPDHVLLETPGGQVLVAHALPGDPFHGVEHEAQAQLSQRTGVWRHWVARDQRVVEVLDGFPDAQLFVTFHTHFRHQRVLGERVIVNPGAVMCTPHEGGNPARAQYLLLTWQGDRWHTDFRDVPFDPRPVLASLQGHMAEVPYLEHVAAMLTNDH